MTTENQHDIDDDLNDDLNDEGGDGNNESSAQVPAIKPGEQEDGSFVLEVEGDDAANQNNGEGTNTEVNEGEVDEQEAKRAARRAERAEQKKRRQEKDERIRRELESERNARKELEQRLAVIERRAQGSEVAQLDEGIKQIANAYEFQKQRLTAAQEAGNAAEATDAMEKMMNLQRRGEHAMNVKKAFEQKQSAPQPLDPRLKTNAESFLQKNAWYKPEGADADSQVLRALDNALAGEGWDPRTAEYWDELQSRVKKYLPHRVAGGKVPSTETQSSSTTKPKSVVSGSGRDTAASGSGKPVFKLSADRVRTMKEAGVWDDPKQREEAIKAYRAYDKQHGKA